MLFWLSFYISAQFACYSWAVRIWTNPCGTFLIWLNGEGGASFATIMVGATCNIVFGFVDNGGLFIGLDFLVDNCILYFQEEFFALLPASDDANVVAGYGNTYSDMIGAFLGPFFAAMAIAVTGIPDGPFWSNSIGILVGCLLGIAVPKMIFSDSL